MSFANKVVVVAGGSSGIGAAAAISFAKEGADVVIIGRNEEKLNNVSDQCEKVGKKPLIVKADIGKDEETKMAIAKIIEKFGNLDILINNAGIAGVGSILDGTMMAVYDEVMNINLRSLVHLTSLSAPYLIKSKGNIINIASVIGSMTSPVIPSHVHAYAISKAGLIHFTRVAAAELATVGVRVNCISPGPVYTDMTVNAGHSQSLIENLVHKTALRRISDSQEIADLILFVASDKARAITGSEYVSDNGMLLVR